MLQALILGRVLMLSISNNLALLGTEFCRELADPNLLLNLKAACVNLCVIT